MKRSQISVFIIIGIVFLVIMLILYTLSQKVRPEPKPPGEPEEDLQQIMQTYVKSCASEASKKAILLIGLQGGAIYDYQAEHTKYFLGPGNGYSYGMYVLPFEHDSVIYNVSYALSAPVLGGNYHPDVPLYPFGLTGLISDPKELDSNFVNSFGNFPSDPFTPLCDFHGSNSINYSESVACETYDSSKKTDINSVQEYLERFIEHKTEECMRPKGKATYNNYTIGNATAIVTFGEDDISVSLRLPVTITVGDVEQTIMLEDFNVRYDVRLKKIHELVSHLVSADANDIYFNIVRDAKTLNNCAGIAGGNDLCLRDGMEVTKRSNVCLGSGLCREGNYDDMLIIKDTQSSIDGSPYLFFAAIENRVPVLDLIRKEKGTGSYRYDYIVPVGSQILIEPKALDPDEDLHGEDGFMSGFYHYYDWKQNYDDLFSCPKGGCPIEDTKYITHVNDNPRKWTLSTNYAATRRDAAIQTSYDDIGLHTVRVEVCDEEDLCDWQAVMILVTNNSIVYGNSPYDLPAKYASLEDPYAIASPIEGQLLGLETPIYKWSISDGAGNIVWTGSSSENYRDLPSSYNIMNIKNKMGSFFKRSGKYSVRVDILNTDGTIAKPSSDAFELEVMQCLPHRSIEPSYPFSSNIDPFFANHTCCIGDPSTPDEPGWGTVAKPSHICAKIVEYGCREDPHFKPESRCSGTEVSCPLPGSSVYDDGIENDIYKRTIERHCDGTRGNVCLGVTSETRVRVKECDRCETCVYSAKGMPDCKEIPGCS